MLKTTTAPEGTYVFPTLAPSVYNLSVEPRRLSDLHGEGLCRCAPTLR